MGVIREAVVHEIRQELSLQCQSKSNWGMTDEYQTILHWTFGTAHRLICWFHLIPNGQLRCSFYRTAQIPLGNLADRNIFELAAARVLEAVELEAMPFLSTSIEDRRALELLIFKAADLAEEYSSDSAGSSWRWEVITAARTHIEHELQHSLEQAEETRLRRWQLFLQMLDCYLERRPSTYFCETFDETLSTLFPAHGGLARSAEIYDDGLQPRFLRQRDRRNNGFVWFRDRADLDTLLMAGGLL